MQLCCISIINVTVAGQTPTSKYIMGNIMMIMLIFSLTKRARRFSFTQILINRSVSENCLCQNTDYPKRKINVNLFLVNCVSVVFLCWSGLCPKFSLPLFFQEMVLILIIDFINIQIILTTINRIIFNSRQHCRLSICCSFS